MGHGQTKEKRQLQLLQVLGWYGSEEQTSWHIPSAAQPGTERAAHVWVWHYSRSSQYRKVPPSRPGAKWTCNFPAVAAACRCHWCSILSSLLLTPPLCIIVHPGIGEAGREVSQLQQRKGKRVFLKNTPSFPVGLISGPCSPWIYIDPWDS